MKFKKNVLKIIIPLFFITLVIIGITRIQPKSKAEEIETVGNNTGYGMVTITYHSNYLKATAQNGERADEVTYQITTPIYINSKGEYCISLGEYKFKEMQISSDGISSPNEDANAIDTGFRGYTLNKKPERNDR